MTVPAAGMRDREREKEEEVGKVARWRGGGGNDLIMNNLWWFNNAIPAWFSPVEKVFTFIEV